ncbi:hypothetical protein SELMODRAFT_427689 [Selaginella moellendorffii]|uniref:FGAR-AT PurM N-terminal-like domain-containing protein n=1 Tax=Selaginella moellendorffii TaxID=88036 RepID=D8T0E5_SELML|nr:hypothetical protein SELMODRAFT_430322 [Selaginella moellendorffii]EFJ09894.1 hypothetical protein SELMODRAFT_427689 [Selaginella moellendorffii]
MGPTSLPSFKSSLSSITSLLAIGGLPWIPTAQFLATTEAMSFQICKSLKSFVELDSEGAHMYNAAVALRDTMIELEVAIEGGKDSLSMAAQAGGETVKAPGNLVISTPNSSLFSYSDTRAYRQSKLANIFHAKELAMRFKGFSSSSPASFGKMCHR